MRGLLSLSVAMAAAVGARSGPAPPEETVATVNGEAILRSEFVRELMVRHGKAVLEDMIRQRAIRQEMERANISVTDREIDEEIERERRALAQERDRTRTLEDVVAERYQMSMEGYRDIVARWLLIRKLILRRERPTEDELLLWFVRNRERYDAPAQVTVSHIFVARKDPYEGRERPEAEIRERLESIRRGLLAGEEFASLARRYSDDLATRNRGGELGTVNERAARANLEPDFVNAMTALRPGQSGGPVETTKGYHYLHVTARQEGHKVEYEDVRERVKVDYLEERTMLMREPFVRELMERTEVTRSFTPPSRTRHETGAAPGGGG